MNETTHRRVTHVTLFLLCCAFVVILSWTAATHPVALDTKLVLLLGLASSFAGRAVAYLKVFEWLRSPFTKVVQHECGVGEYVEPNHIPVIGHLISCPVCAGTWAAEILMETYILFPSIGSIMINVLAGSCVAWFVSYLTEFLEWGKAVMWEMAGKTRAETNILTRKHDV